MKKKFHFQQHFQERKELEKRLSEESLYIRFRAAAQENRYKKCKRFLKEVGYNNQEIKPILEWYAVEKYPWLCRLLRSYCNNYMWV